MPAIGNLTAATQAEVDAVDTQAPVETGSGGATLRGSILQWILSLLRPSKLDEADPDEVTDAAKLLIEDAAFTGRKNKWISFLNLKSLIYARTGQIYQFNTVPQIVAVGWALGDVGDIAHMAAGMGPALIYIPLCPFRVGTTIKRLTVNASMQNTAGLGDLTATLYLRTNIAGGGSVASLGTASVSKNTAGNLKIDVNNLTFAVNIAITADMAFFVALSGWTNGNNTIVVNSIAVTVDDPGT